jgi:glutathione S-transferase
MTATATDSSEPTMKLYDLKTGMNPRRVRIFLAEKGLTVDRVDVDMVAGENKLAPFLSKNPMGTMPVLELDSGEYLSESIAICRYLEELHPQPNLFGSSPLERAHIEMWNRRMELEIMEPIRDGFVHLSPFWVGRRQQIAEYGQLAHALAKQRLIWLDSQLGLRAYVAGERYTVADITLQCALVLGRNTGMPVPEDLVHLQQWYKTVTSRPTARA